MTTGTLWPNTPEHPPLWWLAAEIVEGSNEERVPDGVDPRVWCAEEWPDLHAHWMERIAIYLPHLKQ